MLIRSSFYHLVNLYGNRYLLPFGQKMADQAPAFLLNEAGVWVWENLKQAVSHKELAARAQAQGICSGSDLDDYLLALKRGGLLESREEHFSVANQKETLSLVLAGLTIRLCGDRSLFSKELSAFSCEEAAHPDQTITVTFDRPAPRPGATVVLENEELCVLDAGPDWELVFPSSDAILKASVSKDGKEGFIFLKFKTDNVQYDVFHAIRLLFLILAQNHGLYALHSASVSYRGRAILFSAPSGTGKSTHANLWEKAGWARILNGDLNLLGLCDGKAYVYGIPWCGTSGRFTTKTVPLGAVFLLKRGTSDQIAAPPRGERVLRTAQRLISPIWTRDMLESNFSFCKKLEESTPIRELLCTPDISAAKMVKEYIDENIRKK